MSCKIWNTHIATRCNTLQHTAKYYETLRHAFRRPSEISWFEYEIQKLQHTATHCNTLQHTATHCNTVWDFLVIIWDTKAATHCNTLWQTLRYLLWAPLHHTATHCDTLQHTATHCSTLQHTATHCNTLQHTATHCNTHWGNCLKYWKIR